MSQPDPQLFLQEMRKITTELKRVADNLGDLIMSLNFQKATIPPQKPPEDSSKGPLRPRDTTPTPRMVSWRPFKTGTPGGWIESDENLPLRDTLLAAKNKTVVLEGYTYRLSGDGDKWIQRFPVGPRK
jgi:hypothetical protein